MRAGYPREVRISIGLQRAQGFATPPGGNAELGSATVVTEWLRTFLPAVPPTECGKRR